MTVPFKDFCRNPQISPNPQLITFTTEILNGKLHFLCSVVTKCEKVGGAYYYKIIYCRKFILIIVIKLTIKIFAETKIKISYHYMASVYETL